MSREWTGLSDWFFYFRVMHTLGPFNPCGFVNYCRNSQMIHYISIRYKKKSNWFDSSVLNKKKKQTPSFPSLRKEICNIKGSLPEAQLKFFTLIQTNKRMWPKEWKVPPLKSSQTWQENKKRTWISVSPGSHDKQSPSSRPAALQSKW